MATPEQNWADALAAFRVGRADIDALAAAAARLGPAVTGGADTAEGVYDDAEDQPIDAPDGFGLVVAAHDYGYLSDDDFYDLLTRLENS